MLKGIGKKVVVLKNTDSDVFEEAIFILKPKNSLKEKDLLKECENIINKNSFKKSVNEINKKSKFLRISSVIIIVLLVISAILLTLNLM